MEIGPVQNNKPLQQPSPKPQPQPTGAVTKKEITDRVEISEDARRMLAEMADRALLEEAAAGGAATPAADTEGTSSVRASEENRDDDRLAEIRRRITSGFYDQPEIKNKIADRLSDDLDV